MRTRVFAAMDRAYACAQEIMQPREQQQAAAAERQRAEQAELDEWLGLFYMAAGLC